ncbi:TPA: sensor domain-containing diguanylate cyclase [Vibrio parahaemolyticus]|nr:sensor domain-containing diguanylate cyclase [Vibrio parahaemolyticus]EKO3445046.1 sensor domain-containing diguanylate cyclase [Vibrio fluvialis]EKO3641729.1 sensor domain-containing diguanylate cyclase [Vibrio metschnikovii]EGQ8113178.1 sensor domain-containing diguanylate cyclase [Vibrio parahaemolyticus]EIN4364694.1 sensor domain-containing diguanylate cyclase [Vibrio parahaemolyticus]
MYGVFSYMIIYLVTDKFLERQIQQVKETIQHDVALVRYSIEENIFRDTYLADSFASVVSLDPDFATKNWNSVSSQFLSKAAFVRNIGLAPNDIISHVYPLEGNEKAIGLDFRTVPNQYETVQIAKDTQKVFIAGPLELVQGGTALIARYPIFTDSPKNKNYWGSLSVVINYDKLIEASKIQDISGANIALVASNSNGESNRLIEGNNIAVENYDISHPIYLPNNNWTLFASYKDFSETDGIYKFKIIFMTLGIATFSIGYFLLIALVKNYLRAQNLSLHDELTQLPNRRYLFQKMTKIMSREGSIVEFTVLNIDLNKFKQINDSLGHEAGDEVLKHTASSLNRCLRSSDFISRVGGDEFVVILHRVSNEEDVDKVIHNMHLCLESSPLHWNSQKIWISLSIGSYTFKSKANPKLINEVLFNADKSMYFNKSSAKNKDIEFFI